MDLRRLRELTEATTRAQELLARSDFMQAGQRVRALIDTSKFAEATLLGAEAAKYIPDPSQWMPRLPDVALMAQQIERTQRHYAAILNSTSIAGVLDEVNRVRPIIEKYQEALAKAPDESSERLTLRDYALALIEGTSGLKMRLKTPYERWVFWVSVMMLIFRLTSDANNAREQSESRRLTSEQGQLINRLTDEIRQAQRKLADHDDLPEGPMLRVANPARLRALPSADAQIVGRFEPGTKLELIVALDRWFYVEVLAEDGKRTGLRGWVYRRVVRTR
jgi:hypothetical protein